MSGLLKFKTQMWAFPDLSGSKDTEVGEPLGQRQPRTPQTRQLENVRELLPALAPAPDKISLKMISMATGNLFLKKVRNNAFGRNSTADRIFSDYT